MTRVICHEINNLLANQRGYGNLLRQRGPAVPDAPRWLGEMSKATLELQDLITGLQAQSRRPADAVRGDRWPPEPAVATVAAQLARSGSGLGETALERVLTIIAAECAAAGADWSPAKRAPWPSGSGILGSAPTTGAIQILSIQDHSGGLARGRWVDSASRILPGSEAPSDAWNRALVLGLLRQCGGELLPPDGQSDRFILVIPTTYVDLEGDSF
jgi:hypothetical protein